MNDIKDVVNWIARKQMILEDNLVSYDRTFQLLVSEPKHNKETVEWKEREKELFAKIREAKAKKAVLEELHQQILLPISR
jgi:hypothetical protein